MLSEIFKALLITSLAGTCLATVIAFTKPITKKIFGYAWHYYVWLCVLFVMLMPVRFTLSQKTEIPPITATPTIQTEQTVQEVQNTDNIVSDVQTKPKTDILQAVTSLAKKAVDNILNILAYLWLIGAVVLLHIYIIGYISLIRKMHKNSAIVSCPELTNFTDKRVTVRVWENTSTPFMVGIFKPTLVLPDGELTEEQLNNIIRHEMTHFKRHDILYKWFAEFVKCVHWFNPIVWYVSKQIATECEISCDMTVTKNMSDSEEMSYINTILSLLPKDKSNRLSLTTQMASGKKVLKRRFTMIKNKKTTSRFMSVLSAVVAVIMLSTTVFASGVLSDITTDEWKNPFTDVKENDWFFESVKYVNKNGLMSGTTDTTFAPNMTLTRAMLVTVLYRAGGEPAVNKSIPFSDVKTDMYYANAVIWAQQNGIVNGVTETEFAPDENITREEIATIIYRYAKANRYDVSVGENTNILSYTDFDEISEYAIETMQYAGGSGLMKGKTETTLNPKDNATRAEIAAILQRFIEGNK